MTDNIRAAAERIRRTQNQMIATVYGRNPISQLSGLECVELQAVYNGDLRTLAEAYLAEHPADDGEPVDNEFCESIVGKPNRWGSGTVDWQIPSDDFDVVVRVWNFPSPPDLILANRNDVGNFQIQIENRGQLRRLLEALKAKEN